MERCYPAAMRPCRFLLCAVLLIPSLQAQRTAPPIRIWAKILDHHGRPAPGTVVRLISIPELGNHLQDELLAGFHGEFQVTSTDGLVCLEAPAGWWNLDITRKTKKRGFPATERYGYSANNFGCFAPGPPIYEMPKGNDSFMPRVFRLGAPEWDNDAPAWDGTLDMTTPTQGQTFTGNEMRSVPMR